MTSTNPKLFQAPYRAGIEVKTYQLEPLRKALAMPRVSLFIADDVGLGKTIEAGLILREMLLRQKIRRVVIACPPSVVRQWQEEMENRFGLLFQVFDREFVATKRRERGYGINPWSTHSRFIISHALLRDEGYAASLRDWLGDFAPGTMLILDEAHNAAPASSARYAIDSQLTKSIRELAPKFEHKLFLSATPHNGHSNSFASLLEMLDPQRFCRGVPVKSQKILDIEAFARTLKVHRQTIEKQADKTIATGDFSLLRESIGNDDDRAGLTEAEIEGEENSQMARATQLGGNAIGQRERELLDRMISIAESARYQPDGKIDRLIDWMRQHQCPDLGTPGAKWLQRRVIIFTEYTDTKRYIEQQLKVAIAGSDLDGNNSTRIG